MPLKLAVLLSGGGTTMQNLAERIAAGTLDASIGLVITSNDGPAAKGLARAEALQLPGATVRRKDHADTESFSAAVFDRVREAECGLVCMAGFLSLLVIPDDFAGRVMNIHPSLLPAFGGKGMHGRHVHEAVLAAGCKVSGCTVHLADNTYDTGPIVLQRACAVLPGDTAESLAARVFAEECEAYPAAVAAFAAGRVRTEGGLAWVEGEGDAAPGH
ncbi:MAG: phosphoribosylglycinamide formyltransferase [Planctomycetota bacterium]